MPHPLNNRRIEFRVFTSALATRHGNYSRRTKHPSFLAPAVSHNFASSTIFWSRIGGGALLLRNTRAFLSFQIVQETSMVREAIARLLGFRMSVLLSHHCMRESSRCQLEVSMCTRSNLSMTDRQSLMEKRHLMKRWMPDFFSRLQRGQSPQFSQPRRCNRSAVQIRSSRPSKRRI